MQKLKKFISDELFPETFTCHICRTEIFEGELCSDCRKITVFNDGDTCPVCGRKTAKSEICIECKAHMPQFTKAVSAFVYDGGAAILIAKFKKGAPWLSEYFAKEIFKKLSALPKFDGIVAVPMTKKAKRKRGYNQAELIAEKLSRLSGTPMLYGAVEKTKNTPVQKGLTRAERETNLAGCFKAKRKAVKGKTILVVDDVMTTGATLDALCKKLKSAGAYAVFCATAASVEYSSAP